MPLLKSSTLSADGTTDAVYCDSGPVWFSASGSFGGGDLNPVISLDGTNYAPLTVIDSSGALVPVVLTTAAALQLDLPDSWVKATLSGSTDPSLVFNVNKLPREKNNA